MKRCVWSLADRLLLPPRSLCSLTLAVLSQNFAEDQLRNSNTDYAGTGKAKPNKPIALWQRLMSIITPISLRIWRVLLSPLPPRPLAPPLPLPSPVESQFVHLYSPLRERFQELSVFLQNPINLRSLLPRKSLTSTLWTKWSSSSVACLARTQNLHLPKLLSLSLSLPHLVFLRAYFYMLCFLVCMNIHVVCILLGKKKLFFYSTII